MNCDTCGILYQDHIPHPPAACATHAGVELKKAKKALDGALEQISVLMKERDEILTPKEVNLAMDSVSRNFRRLQDFHSEQLGRKSSNAVNEVLSKELEELRQFHLKLVKWKRRT
jgi:hypothetical protein